MPGRSLPLVNGQIYHVYNRGIDHRPTFTSKRDYQRANLAIKYYRFVSHPTRLATFLSLSKEDRERIFFDLTRGGKTLVDILSFCFMPNHFHFLLKQIEDNGISRFMSNFQNSYTRYFNSKYQRVGPIFLGQFKAVWIENEEQLLHVSRYIHLNPYSSFIIKKLGDLSDYQWSSLPEYLGLTQDVTCTKDQILFFFKSNDKYKEFIFNQADYQRQLDKIKHLTEKLP